MSERAFCPYHGSKWRSLAQFMLNQMRNEKLLKPVQIRRFPSVVCSCQGASSTVGTPKLPRKRNLVKWKESLVDSKIYSSIDRLMKAESQHDISDEYRKTITRMLGVIYLVYHNENEFLNPPPAPTPPPPLDATPEPAVKEPKPFLPDIEREFLLDIPVTPVTYIGNLIGSHGIHLKNVCAKYKVEDVHLGNPKDVGGTHGKYCHSSPIKVTYRYKPDSESVTVEFKKALERRAKEVCDKRQRHFENVKRYHEVRRRRALEWRERQERLASNYDGLLDHKEGSLLRTHQKHKHKEKDKQKVKPPPILDDSKCLNCRQPHSTEGKECIYHPGFIVNVKQRGRVTKRWTCCNKYHRQHNTLLAEHVRTGCAVGVHNWRPVRNCTKGKSRPATNNKEEIEDIVFKKRT